MRHLALLLFCLFIVGCGRGVVQPLEVLPDLTLVGAAPNGKDLVLHLANDSGDTLVAFATAQYNARWHAVDASGLRITSRGWAGPVAVTYHPDPWVPQDGKPFTRTYRLGVWMADDGRWQGSWTEALQEGEVHGSSPGFIPARRHLRLRLYGALQRLVQAKGPNTHYALDQWLICDVVQGRVENVMLETVVPDYRGYSVKVERHDLTFKDNRLSGTVTTMVDYGGQGASSKWEDHLDRHVFQVDALAIGDAAAGRYAVDVVDHLKVEDLWCQGVSENDPPPAPAQSRCWLRLHDAMRQDWPVRLELSLGETIHGYAWVPRYNHQPHTVDASRLELEGDRLRGPVTVTVVPDVYHDHDVSFDLHYDVDVVFDGRAASGSFAGRDGDLVTRGIVTGETRAKAPPAVASLADLESVTLGLGWCLGGGGAKAVNAKGIGDHAEALVALEDGTITGVTLRNPKTKAGLPTSAAACELNLEGDRLTGRLTFTIAGGSAYAFDLTAIVDGDHLGGYWRATRDGQALLTKSSKLGGRLLPRKGP